MSDLEQLYSRRIDAFSIEISAKKNQLLLINIGRLISFLLFLILPFWIYSNNHLLGVILPFLSLIVFLFLVKLNVKVAAKKKYLENLVSICNKEIEAIQHNFSGFDPGSEFIDPDHINSYDLDIFGKGSLFQFINRTVTYNGKSALAEMLLEPILVPSRLKMRQELVAELVTDIEWRQDFAASGMMYNEEKEESDIFGNWGKDKFKLRCGDSIPKLLIILPLFSLFSIGYWIIFRNSAFFLLSILLQIILWTIEKKNISRIYRQFGKRVEILSKYASLLGKIEEREWKSDEARELLKGIELRGIPSKEISTLRRIVSAFDNRNNFLIGLVLNVVFVWDILCSYLLIRWHDRNAENYKVWESTIAFFDAICSLSNMAFNHQGYVFPLFDTGKFHFEAEHIGHPLIHPDKIVTNHFTIELEKQIVIITGANMAGKSTFLRTAGVNMVLGMAGAPVCASRLVFVPVEVFSNMRTTDSLFDDESYFFAELKRIKTILDAVESGRPVLIILDEILKGTNSVDKLAGSQRLVKKMIGLEVPAIIATHDLKLTEMKAEYPDNIQNDCFEITIEDNEMFFDYTLREGVTQTMNATFLMKKMGII